MTWTGLPVPTLTVRNANSQVSELIAKHWIERQSFYQLRRIQNSWIGRQACLETFWVVSSCFQVFASFCPLSPPFLHPFNYNFQTVSVIFLRLFTYGEFLSHFYRAQYIKSNLEMQYIHIKLFPFIYDSLIHFKSNNILFVNKTPKRIKINKNLKSLWQLWVTFSLVDSTFSDPKSIEKKAKTRSFLFLIFPDQTQNKHYSFTKHRLHK